MYSVEDIHDIYTCLCTPNLEVNLMNSSRECFRMKSSEYIKMCTLLLLLHSNILGCTCRAYTPYSTVGDNNMSLEYANLRRKSLLVANSINSGRSSRNLQYLDKDILYQNSPKESYPSNDVLENSDAKRWRINSDRKLKLRPNRAAKDDDDSTSAKLQSISNFGSRLPINDDRQPRMKIVRPFVGSQHLKVDVLPPKSSHQNKGDDAMKANYVRPLSGRKHQPERWKANGKENDTQITRSEQIRMFAQYIKPFLPPNISYAKVRYIISQWQYFRQQIRLNNERIIEGIKNTNQAHIPQNGKLSEQITGDADLKNMTKERKFQMIAEILPVHDSKSSTTRAPFTKNDNPASIIQAEDTQTELRQPIDLKDHIHISKETVIYVDRNSKKSTKNSRNETLGDDETTIPENDLQNAFKETERFLNNSCILQNVTLCTQALLGMSHQDFAVLLPPGVKVQRCSRQEQMVFVNIEHTSNQSSTVNAEASDEHLETYPLRQYNADSCSCPRAGDECLPTAVGLKTYSVLLMSTIGKTSSELIAVTEHLECGCQPRCSRRKCVPPLVFKQYTLDDCFCACLKEDKRCERLLEGKTSFTEAELPVPLNGSYIMPPCYYGPMDDLHYYHRRCPRPIPRRTLYDNAR